MGQTKYLSPEFLSTYQDYPDAWQKNTYGFIVYKRTYSRWVRDRREHWKETVSRAVEYSLSLYNGPASYDDLCKEAEILFDYIFNLKIFPAGRTLWIGGTEASEKYPMSNFNCAFRVVDDLQAFVEIFYGLKQ